MTNNKSNSKRFRSLLITVFLVIGVNIAISESGLTNTISKAGISVMPDAPRPKAGISVMPDAPRPKAGISVMPDAPRPKAGISVMPDAPRP